MNSSEKVATDWFSSLQLGDSVLPSEIIPLLRDLYASNSLQWKAENESRADGADAVRLKRRIDELNSRRHSLIEQIDRVFAIAFPSKPHLVPLLDTLGACLDRLTVAALRVSAARIQSDIAEYARLIPIVEQQKEDLAIAVRSALVELSEGKKRLPLPDRPKLYVG